MSEAAKINKREDVLQFVTAGHAHFTLRSTSSGSHLTFAVRRAKTSWATNQAPPWFVQVRVGSESLFIGTIFADKMSFVPTKNLPPGTEEGVKVFTWFWRKVQDQALTTFSKLEVWHEGICSACGQPLTNPESIAVGLGPVCRKKGRRILA